MKRKFCAIVAVLCAVMTCFCLQSCGSEGEEVEVAGLECETVCNLDQSERMIGRIYVFSAMDLKFVAYDTEGRFIEEYPYEPAIGDFISCGTGR